MHGPQDATPRDAPGAAHRAGGITPRAIVVGLVGTIVLGVITPYCDLVLRGTWIACSHLPIGVLVLFFITLAINTPLLHWLRDRGFSPRELYAVYAMMLVGAGIPSFGLTEYLFPTLAGAYYFATPENHWIERLFQYLPQWLFPFDLKSAMETAPGGGSVVTSDLYTLLPAGLQPGGRSVVTAFYEGLRPGQSVPWGAWAVPLVAWTLAALVLFFCMICLSVILRRRWIDHERLVFPLVQVPLELARDQSPASPLPPFFRHHWMWIGCAIPLLIHSINGLHFYFPAVPEIKLVIPLRQNFTGRLWSNMGIFTMFIHFSVIGFTYLISTELSFSFWFFFLFFIAEGALFASFGVQLKPLPGYPTPPHGALQMIGAFVTLAGTMAWTSRRHLGQIWEQAVGRLPADDAHEPLPFRTALFGGAIGLGLFALWCLATGVGAGLVGLVIVLFFMFALVLTRLVSEGGLLFVQGFRPTDVIIACAGTHVIGARSLTVLSFIQKVFMFDLRGFLMPSLMDAHKLADASGLNPRKLLPWLGLAIVAAVVSSYVAFLLMAYHLGGIRFTNWFLTISPQQTLSFVTGYLNQPYPTSPANWVLMLGGAGTTVFLAVMRALYTWWPFHPLGYAMGPSWPMIQLWFSVLVGWALKSVILRYGGFKRFREAKPFFLGLVVGEFSAAGLWLLIDFLCGQPGHHFFLT